MRVADRAIASIASPAMPPNSMSSPFGWRAGSVAAYPALTLAQQIGVGRSCNRSPRRPRSTFNREPPVRGRRISVDEMLTSLSIDARLAPP